MALVYAGIPCALCGEPIADPMRDTFTMTMWCFDDLRFAPLDDAACHQKCIGQWNLRDDFIDYFNRNYNNQLHLDRHGHVAYRFDYVHWAVSALAFALGILICGPPLALLEVGGRPRSARFTAIASPYAILATIVTYFTIRSSFGVALLYGAIFWSLGIVAFVFVVWPTAPEKK